MEANSKQNQERASVSVANANEMGGGTSDGMKWFRTWSEAHQLTVVPPPQVPPARTVIAPSWEDRAAPKKEQEKGQTNNMLMHVNLVHAKHFSNTAAEIFHFGGEIVGDQSEHHTNGGGILLPFSYNFCNPSAWTRVSSP